MVRPYRELTTVDRVRKLFSYDPETGVLLNRVAHGRSRLGVAPGYLRPDGYRIVCVDGARYLAHRIAWMHHYGEWPTQHLDHIDRNPRNNAISNLRECDDAENAQNLDTKGYGTSGYLGVTKYFRDPNRWVAKIKVNQHAMHLGVFNCRTAAYVAYCKAKTKWHTFAAGEVANV